MLKYMHRRLSVYRKIAQVFDSPFVSISSVHDRDVLDSFTTNIETAKTLEGFRVTLQ